MSTPMRMRKLSSPTARKLPYPSSDASWTIVSMLRMNTSLEKEPSGMYASSSVRTQHPLSRHEPGRNLTVHRGRLVDHAEDLVPRLQAVGYVIDNDVVEHIATAAVEGAHVVAGDEPEAEVLRCWDCHGQPSLLVEAV